MDAKQPTHRRQIRLQLCFGCLPEARTGHWSGAGEGEKGEPRTLIEPAHIIERHGRIHTQRIGIREHRVADLAKIRRPAGRGAQVVQPAHVPRAGAEPARERGRRAEAAGGGARVRGVRVLLRQSI